MGASCSKVVPIPQVIYIMTTRFHKTRKEDGLLKLIFSFTNVPSYMYRECWDALKTYFVNRRLGSISNLDRSLKCYVFIDPQRFFVGNPALILPAQHDKPEVKLKWF